MRLGRMFWVTVIAAIAETVVGVMTGAGAIGGEVATWVLGGIALIAGSHNVARGFEDGMTKKQPNGVTEVIVTAKNDTSEVVVKD